MCCISIFYFLVIIIISLNIFGINSGNCNKVNDIKLTIYNIPMALGIYTNITCYVGINIIIWVKISDRDGQPYDQLFATFLRSLSDFFRFSDIKCSLRTKYYPFICKWFDLNRVFLICSALFYLLHCTCIIVNISSNNNMNRIHKSKSSM